MANEQNLRPGQYKFTLEDAKRGQEASARKRRERKKFEELFNSYLDKKVANEQIKEQMKQFGFTDKECTNKNAIVFAQYKEALKGSTQAFVAVRDTIGEKPKDNVNISGNINNPFEGLSTEELRQLINNDN